MQKIDLKNAFTPFWASKSTSKTLSLHFEPQKALQKHFDSILSLKKYLKNILTRFWASKSTSRTFWLNFEPQKAPQKYFDSILSLKKHHKNILRSSFFIRQGRGVLHTPHKRSRKGSERTNHRIAFSYHGRGVLHTPHKRSRKGSEIVWYK